MRVTLAQYETMTKEQQARVTHLDLTDPEQAPYRRSALSNFEEHEGEANARRLTDRGFNK